MTHISEWIKSIFYLVVVRVNSPCQIMEVKYSSLDQALLKLVFHFSYSYVKRLESMPLRAFVLLQYNVIRFASSLFKVQRLYIEKPQSNPMFSCSLNAISSWSVCDACHKLSTLRYGPSLELFIERYIRALPCQVYRD